MLIEEDIVAAKLAAALWPRKARRVVFIRTQGYQIHSRVHLHGLSSKGVDRLVHS
jgi:hypothetical protein